MARNLQEARRMLAAARESGLVTALYPPMPGLRGDRVVRRLLADGDYVGEIREVRVAGLAHQQPGDDYVWQIDPEVAGLNTMTMGMWAEVLNRWVGPARSLSATATSHLGEQDDGWTEGLRRPRCRTPSPYRLSWGVGRRRRTTSRPTRRSRHPRPSRYTARGARSTTRCSATW